MELFEKIKLSGSFATAEMGGGTAVLNSSNVPENMSPRWNPATAYTTGQFVTYSPNGYGLDYDGTIYRRLTNGTTSTAPNADTTNWAVETPNVSDPPEWLSGFSYAVNEIASDYTDKGVYLRTAAGSGTTRPGLDPTNWKLVRPTSRYALFDLVNVTAASVGPTTGLSMVVTPGVAFNRVAVFGVVALFVQVRVQTSAGVTVYDQTIGTDQRRQALWQLPSTYSSTHKILIDFSPITGVPISVGSLVFGLAVSYGTDAQHGTRLGIVDYSVKSTNEFGDSVLIKRAYARRMDAQIQISSSSTDIFIQRLADLRATPVVWVFSTAYTSTVILGIYKDFEVTLAFPDTNYCTLQIEGLT